MAILLQPQTSAEYHVARCLHEGRPAAFQDLGKDRFAEKIGWNDNIQVIDQVLIISFRIRTSSWQKCSTRWVTELMQGGF